MRAGARSLAGAALAAWMGLGAAAAWAGGAGTVPKLRRPAAHNGLVALSDRYRGFPFRLKLSDAQREALTDQKRDQVIAQLQRIAAKFDDDSPQKPEMLFQLSEYYWEKSQYLYRLEMTRLDAAYQRYQQAQQQGLHVPAPVEDHRPSERYRALTMQIYERILASYPHYARRDEVLFSLAFNLYEIGKEAQAVQRYQELITRYPQSQFVPDAYLQLGNHYFEHNDLARATANYRRALATRVPKIYSYALYKLAWCDYNAGAFESARNKLQQVVDFPQLSGEDLVDLRNEALNDLVLVFVRLGRPDEAMAYFQRKASGPRQRRLIAKMAAGLLDAGRNDDAVRVFRYLLAQNAFDPSAPDWQQSIVRAYEGLRQRVQVKQEVKRLAELYRPGSAWWQANRADPKVLASGYSVSEEAMRTLVTDYHQEAQRTKQVETYRLARDIYRQYLAAFASSADPRFISDYAFNMKFYDAEILWTLQDWAAAAQAYDQVVAFKIPDRESAREVSNESYRLTAAYDAVLAYDKLVKIERGELAASNLEDGQKVDEKEKKGRVDQDAKILKRDTQSLQPQPLTFYEQKLIQACDRYADGFHNPKDEIDIRYRAALILYNRNHFVEASQRFGQIILKWPEEKRSQEAADLAMAVLDSQQAWGELNTLARQFAANRRLTRPGTDFAARVARVVAGSRYNYLEEVVYRKQQHKEEAAQQFLAYADQYPRSEHADQALAYATLIFEEIHQNDRGIAAGERLLRDYPGSPLTLKIRYALAHLYERTADFRRAAEAYEAFVAAYDRLAPAKQRPSRTPAHPAARTGQEPVAADRARLLQEASAWVPDAQFDAALWWEGLGRVDRAIADYQTYLTRFPDRADVPDIAFGIGLLQERQKRWRDAERTFEAFDRRFAHDGRVTAARRYVALDHAFQDALQGHQPALADRLESELLRTHGHLSVQERQEPEVVKAFARARFQALEPAWRTYQALRLDRVRSLKADLMAKQKRLQELERGYLEILSLGDGEYGIAALARIGAGYEDLAQNIRASPDPRGLTADQRTLYRSALESVARPLEDKAVLALQQGLAKAYELSLYSNWTLQAQEEVNRFHPGSYGPVHPAAFDDGELDAPAAVVPGPRLGGRGKS